MTAANATDITHTVYITRAPASTELMKHPAERSCAELLSSRSIGSPNLQTTAAAASDDSMHAPKIMPPAAALPNTCIPAVPITKEGPLP